MNVIKFRVFCLYFTFDCVNSRGGSRAAATSNMEGFVIIFNGWKPLTIVRNRSILDVAAVLDAPLNSVRIRSFAGLYFTAFALNIHERKYGSEKL